MSKKSNKSAETPRTEMPSIKTPVREKIEVVVYSFPSRCRCPRCGSIDTQRYTSHGRFQYRKCRVAVCRYRFRVVGTVV